MTGGGQVQDPLASLREYRRLAPWSLRDLTALTAAILDAAGVRPINAAASAHPTERTIRFYVARNLVTPPEGRGTAATYSYRHLLEVLAIKLRQMEGSTLAGIAKELSATAGDVLERRVAAALGSELPAPAALPLFSEEDQPRGRAGQIFRVWSRPGTDEDEAVVTVWQRMPVDDGLELHIRENHPAATREDLRTQIGDAIRLAIGRILSPLHRVSDATSDDSSSERSGHSA
jgi:DNA-binding transcriptional MerR regulator